MLYPLRPLMFTAVLMLALCPPAARAAGVEDVVGLWKMTTSFNGRDIESDVTFELKDGVLTGSAKMQMGGRGPRGEGGGAGRGPTSRELLDVAYDNGTLSWGIVMPRAGNEPLRTTVTITGDTFEGATKVPFGDAKVTGRKWTAEAEQKLQDAINGLLGDWDIITTYNGKDSQSQMRLAQDEERGLRLAILMPGATLDVRRVRFDGAVLQFSTNMPFIGDEPARARLTVTGNKCEGAIASPLGDIPLRGERIDTAKLVLAPYDDPKPVLGTWDVTANVRGEESQAKLAIEADGERLNCTVRTNDNAFESTDVDYTKVGEKMGRVRMIIAIPSLGDTPQTFELIFNGDAFEGEEVHSNGQIYFEGSRAAG